MSLPIHEIFKSWQGEGRFAGQSAFFIRTYGCPVQCPWCDSAGTWHKDYRPSKVNKMQVEELVLAAKNSDTHFTVVTGGEPCIHNLIPLTELMRGYGIDVHLETSGAFPIRGEFEWVTVSPKIAKLPLASSLNRANEIKLIIDSPDALEEWENRLNGIFPNWNSEVRLIYLHPEWSQRENPAILNAITRAISRNKQYIAGWQLHKLYGSDALDPRSAPLVPLGGNPKLGM